MRGVFKYLYIYDEPEAPNGGVFKIYDEPHWSGVLKVYDSRNRRMRGVFKYLFLYLYIYDKPEAPNRGACSRYMMNPTGLAC